jgi:hypothetical protein
MSAPRPRPFSGLEDLIVLVGHSVGSAEAALVAAEQSSALLVYLFPHLQRCSQR